MPHPHSMERLVCLMTDPYNRALQSGHSRYKINHTPMPDAELQPVTLVDAHVHIYSCFDLETLLACAAGNFSTAAATHAVDDYTAVVMLSETAHDDAFSSVRERTVQTGDHGDWRFEATSEAQSIVASHGDSDSLIIVAGRQIVTSEGLEILALATVDRIPDGLPAAETLDRVDAADAIAVLPWGVGKWLGRRGRLADTLLDRTPTAELALGDNSGRPWFFPYPAQFEAATTSGRRILPGTDPLPFRGEEARVGTVGSVLHASISASEPASSLKSLLRDLSVRVEPYMKTERLLPFVRNQLGMQMRKRLQ